MNLIIKPLTHLYVAVNIHIHKYFSYFSLLYAIYYTVYRHNFTFAQHSKSTLCNACKFRYCKWLTLTYMYLLVDGRQSLSAEKCQGEGDITLAS
jgi:hypothetical protein